MRRLLIILFSILIVATGFAGDRLPIPEVPVNYNPRDVIRDPGSGDSIVGNQLLLAFKEQVNQSKQKAILASIDGRIIGGMPAIDVYQIYFENPQNSITRFQDVYDVLKLQDGVLFVMPRKIHSNLELTDHTYTPYKRAGGLTLDPVNSNAKATVSNTYEGAVSAHRPGLIACVERKSRLFKNFHGTVEFEMTISSDGQVNYARVISSSFKDRRMLRCLVNKVRKWKNFPQHTSDSNVSMHFTFEF